MNLKLLSLLAISIASVGLIFLAGCAVSDDPPSTTATTPEPEAPVVLHLSIPKTELQEGEQPKLTITLTNNQRTPITLVLPGDGSDCGWRTPIVGWSVIQVKDGAAATHPVDPPLDRGLRCGNINSLKKDEVFSIETGKSKELSGWVGGPSIAGPGTYSLVFYYHNDPGRQWVGIPLGRHDPEAMKQVMNSFKCALMSNELRLVVKEKKP